MTRFQDERFRLEDLLRSEMQEARETYESAAQHYRKLMSIAGPARNDAGAPFLMQAREAYTSTLVAYTNALRRFTEWVVEGKAPETYTARNGSYN